MFLQLRECPAAEVDADTSAWPTAVIGALGVVIVLLCVLIRDVRHLTAVVHAEKTMRERHDAAERRRRAVEALRHPDPETDPSHLIAPADLDTVIDHCVEAAANARYVEAGALLERLQATLDHEPSSDERPPELAAAAARLAKLEAPGGALEHVRERSVTCKQVLHELNEDAGWNLASDREGTRVQYKRTAETLSVKIDAIVEGVRPADALYIWREASLYKHWFPLMTDSRMLHEASITDVTLHLVADTIFAYSDLVLRGWGCDNLRDGYMLLCVRPVRSGQLPAGVPAPELKKTRKMFPARRVPAVVDVLVEPLSATSVRFAYAASLPIEPLVPHWAINMILQQGMAQIFLRMKDMAKKMAAGDKGSLHLQRMSEPEHAHVAAWIRERVDPYVHALEETA